MRSNMMMWIAWKLPRWLVYWASVRLLAHATEGKYSKTLATKITAIEALSRGEMNYKNRLQVRNFFFGENRGGILICSSAKPADHRLAFEKSATNQTLPG